MPALQGEKKAALTVAVLSSFLTPFMISSVNVALPAIGDALHIHAVLLSWVATVYLLAAAATLLPLGRISDIYGRRRIFIAGVALFTIASVLSAASGTIAVLLLCRALQGVGSAMIFATNLAIVAAVFPPAERGKALGITVAGVYAGLSFGPPAGGYLTDMLSWRWLFLAPAPLGVWVILLAFFRLGPHRDAASGEGFDRFGSFVYAAAVTALLVGISEAPGPVGIGLLAAGAAAMVVFVRRQRKVEHPMFEVDLFSRNRVFSFSSMAALVHYGATFAIPFLLSLYLQYIQGLNSRMAGWVLIAQPVMMALVSPVAGRLSDRIEPSRIASFGMAMTGVALLLLSGVAAATSTTFILAVLVLHGTGFALFSSPNMNAIMGSVPARQYGIASGTVGTMRLFGQTMSMGIATMIFALRIGSVPVTPSVHPAFIESLRIDFIVFAVLCAVGIYLSLSRGSLHHQRKEDAHEQLPRT